MNLIKSIAIMGALFGASSFANDADATCSQADAMELIRINQEMTIRSVTITVTSTVTSGGRKYFLLTPASAISRTRYRECHIATFARDVAELSYDW
jgi:hypothetical protein